MNHSNKVRYFPCTPGGECNINVKLNIAANLWINPTHYPLYFYAVVYPSYRSLKNTGYDLMEIDNRYLKIMDLNKLHITLQRYIVHFETGFLLLCYPSNGTVLFELARETG